MQEAVTRPSVIVHTRSQLEKIEEEMEKNAPRVEIPMEVEGNLTINMTNVEEKMEIDMLPTQVVETLSPAHKRVSDKEKITKKARTAGYVSLKESRQLLLEAEMAQDAERENIRSNIVPVIETQKSVTAMLKEVGLADRSESSETPLGSLDRTAVSLGDSERTTDSKSFIRDQWGTEGTMIKILTSLKVGLKPLNVKSLVSKGPSIPGCRSIIAARCFTSVLKLKQHGFIILRKDPETLEIIDIKLGLKFEEIK